MLSFTPKGHRYPAVIISHCIWLYHRFSLSYRDVEEIMFARGIKVTYESIRSWSIKFSDALVQTLKKKQHNRSDKWHLDEMSLKIKGEKFILWRAVDSDGYELDIFLQKRRDKKSATRFLKKLLGSNPKPRVIVTDKLRSYCKPITNLFPKADHRRHKGLNNRAENSHQPIRRREKSLIKMKSPIYSQKMLKLMGLLRNYFAVDVGRYKNNAQKRKNNLERAFAVWTQTTSQIFCV